MPWQPEGVWQVVYSSKQWKTSPGEDRYRRALYTLWRRTSPYPSMTTFDAPSGETCTIRRIRTNTPLQALVTLNDPTLMEAAQHLADRSAREAGLERRERLARLFRLALARPPTDAEADRLLALRNNAADELAGDLASARKLARYDQVMYTEGRRVKLVDDARGEAPDWRYVSADPGDGWTARSFDASHWLQGAGSFGSPSEGSDDDSADAYSADRGSVWDTDTLWMRMEFEISEPTMDGYRLEIRHSGGFEAHVNGVKAAEDYDGSGTHSPYRLTAPAEAALRPGRNILAVRAIHTGLTGGARHIDVGLSALRRPEIPLAAEEAPDQAAWVAIANVVLNLDETLTRQ